MITLKLRAYSLDEIDTLADLLEQLVEKIEHEACHHNCKSCDLRHLCIDLQSAQLYSSDMLVSRQG